MDLKSKALVVIEYMSMYERLEDMGLIYKASHVANGQCSA